MSGEGTGSEGRIPSFQAKSQRLPEAHQFPCSPLARPGHRDSPSTFRRGRGLPKITSTQARGFLLSENPSSSVGSKASKKQGSLGQEECTKRNRWYLPKAPEHRQPCGAAVPARSEEARPSDLAAATASSALWPPLSGRSDRRRRGAPGACSVHCLLSLPCAVATSKKLKQANSLQQGEEVFLLGCFACFSFSLSLSPLPVPGCWLAATPPEFVLGVLTPRVVLLFFSFSSLTHSLSSHARFLSILCGLLSLSPFTSSTY
jgi:hypothetical protein